MLLVEFSYNVSPNAAGWGAAFIAQI